MISDDPVTLAYHELRSPLGLILTQARLAEENASEPDVRASCNAIARAAERMLRTATAIFALERDPAEIVALEFVPYAVVAPLVDDLQRCDVPVRLVASGAVKTCTVLAAPERFESLLQCLVTNAIDHGVGARPVEIELRLGNGALTMTVSNGWNGGASRHRGLGIGQYLAQRLADEIGAELQMGPRGDRYTATARMRPAPAQPDERQPTRM
jgi:signal transduction histidine kinase